MNYVLAFGLFALVFFAYGNPRLSTDPVIGELADGFPARTAGLEPGDRVVAVDGAGVSHLGEPGGKNPREPGKIPRFDR
jgi:regulator of sigma E protease